MNSLPRIYWHLFAFNSVPPLLMKHNFLRELSVVTTSRQLHFVDESRSLNSHVKCEAQIWLSLVPKMVAAPSGSSKQNVASCLLASPQHLYRYYSEDSQG